MPSSSSGEHLHSCRRGRQKKRLLLGALICFAMSNVLLLWWLHSRRASPLQIEKSGSTPFVAAVEERIRSHIEILKNETLEETLQKLSLLEMYHWPGPPTRNMIQYAPSQRNQADDERDVHAILSNRRFLKALQELSAIPNDQAVSYVNRSLEQALVEYLRLFEEYMNEVAPFFLVDAEAIEGGVALPVSDNADGSPTLAGLRLQILSMVLIASHLKLDHASAVISKVVQTANSQYKQFHDNSSYQEAFCRATLSRVSLYNRQILASCMLSFLAVEHSRTEIVKKYKSQWKAAKLTYYDSKATPYDQHVTRHVARIDYPVNPLVVHYLGPIDEDQYSEIVSVMAKR